jgi:hypothetical protein
MAIYCNRLLAEFRLSIFSVQDASGKTMNLKETFCHKSKFIWFLKFLFFGLAISGLILQWIQSDNLAFWFAFLTQWGILISNFYLFLSFFAAIGWIPITSNENDKEASTWAKILWAFFVTTINSQVIITLLFWVTVYDDDGINYQMIYGHGLILLVGAIDGHVINRTPIRFKQVFFVYLVAVSYTTWTLIHGLSTEIGNIDNQDTNGDDDALYSIINWSQRPLPTLLTVVILFFVVVPVVFVITWGLSVAIPAKYLVEEYFDPKDSEEEP